MASRVFRNMGWLGGAELASRVFRFATTLALAHTFSKSEYGLMAILYVSFDFAFVFIRSGISAKIVQAKQEQLKDICDSSFWINWILCITAFIVQCLIAYPISIFYGNSDLFLPLCFSALTYLIFPFFLIKSALIERENRMKEIAVIHAAQSIVSNSMIVVLVLLKFGIWAIALSMFFSTLLWIIVNFRESSWKMPRHVTFKEWHQVAGFSRNVLGVELLNKLRANLDYLIVGKFLSLDALGLYYFAFNAGSGITMNIVNTFIWALYPHLCSLRQEPDKLKYEYFKSLKTIIPLITLVVVAQSSLSVFYVPLLMGQKWIPAIPVLILICLSVIPTSLKMAGSILLNVDDKPQFTLKFDVVYTVLFAVSLLATVQFGVYWVAFGVLMCHLIMGSLFAVLSAKEVFGTVSARSIS
ncbi:MAG TPA: oligosaccharide flippase family protein [Stenomitos sp.]